ncbi:MAG: carbohydrate-binding family 9-like protein [Cyclobacteriaceae bacterium]
MDYSTNLPEDYRGNSEMYFRGLIDEWCDIPFMNFLTILGVSLILIMVQGVSFAQEGKWLSLGEQKVYKVVKAHERISIDGMMNEQVWQQAESRKFEDFYRIERPSDRQSTTFRMAWDEDFLYLFYSMQDKYLTAREKRRDGEPYNDDCAEIFIIPAPDSLVAHIGFELNLYKACNDFVYFNKYFNNKDYVFKAFDPEYQAETSFVGTINDNSDEDESWNLELAIPLSSFRNLPSENNPKSGNRWAFQAVRQDRNDPKGDRRSTSTLFPIYEASKGVHQANRFGLMEFID